jgi:hypothetical protein
MRYLSLLVAGLWIVVYTEAHAVTIDDAHGNNGPWVISWEGDDRGWRLPLNPGRNEMLTFHPEFFDGRTLNYVVGTPQFGAPTLFTEGVLDTAEEAALVRHHLAGTHVNMFPGNVFDIDDQSPQTRVQFAWTLDQHLQTRFGSLDTPGGGGAPVPKPTTVLLLASGFGAWWSLRRFGPSRALKRQEEPFEACQ